jgi:hypothetical protein
MIHTGLLSLLSAPLTDLAHRELEKSPDGYVALEDTGEDVFFRFMQFLYTGTYMSFQPDKKEEPSKQVEAASQMTASIGEELWNQNIAISSTIHRGCSKDSSHSTTLSVGGPLTDQKCLSKPLSQAVETAPISRDLFGGSMPQQPSTSLFGSGVGSTGGLFGGPKPPQPSTSVFGSGVGSTGGLFGVGGFGATGGLFSGPKPQQPSTSVFDTTGGLFGPRNHYQPRAGLFDSVEVKPTSLGSSPSVKRKFSLDSTVCDCGPSKKKRRCLSDFAQKYTGGIIDQSNVHCKPKTETWSFSFSGHASLWVFANKFDIPALMNLASTRLALELAQHDVWPSAFISEFGNLVRYVYGHCPAGEHFLKKLVTQYAACVVEDVCRLEGRWILLKEVPGFAADLVNQMIDRLC